jgi:hypothetical protein
MDSVMPILEKQLLVNHNMLSLSQAEGAFQQTQHELQLKKVTTQAQQVGLQFCSDSGNRNTPS